MPNNCHCEHTVHFNDTFGPQSDHDYAASFDETPRLAKYVGEICAHCAETHYAKYLVESGV